MLKIADLKIPSRCILAPLAGVSDLPFRLLNRQFGCELAFIEMLNVRSVSYKSKRTQAMLATIPEDRPLGVQILGSEERFIQKALDVLRKYKFDLLDFNAACPAKKVVRRGEGAALLKDPERFKKILKLVVKNTQLPVTVKIRTGWDQTCVNAKEISLLAQDAGVSALFLHGRDRMQGYGAAVDYKVIGQVKKTLEIPVIASGNIFSGLLAKKMFDETGCDGVVVARGALGNPWIFQEITEYLRHRRSLTRPDRNQVISVMLAHLEANVQFYGEKTGVMVFRKLFNWYTKGFSRVRPLREKASRAKTQEQMSEIITVCRVLPK